ncbi:MAG: hypothetical protein MUC38_08615 [Cyclobacteriaceae bacterium]|jgi:hypothetical protein|nr:hypothetical protein [Cyclobacteriaceae bacterium]
MEQNPDTIRSFFFTLALLHGTFVFSLLCVSGGVFFGIDPTHLNQPMASAGRYLVLGLMSATTAAGFLLFGQLTKRVDPSVGLIPKLEKYRGAILLRSALLEMGGVAAAVTALLANDRSLLLLAGVAGVLLLLYRPSRLSFLQAVPLKNEEQALVHT